MSLKNLKPKKPKPMKIIDVQYTWTKAIWFKVLSNKTNYDVRIDTKSNEATCDCVGGVFRIGGRKQEECKHIKLCRKRMEEM